jgi:AcrR family transcriptional regulator
MTAQATGRKARADGQQNRQRLLEVAVRAFAEHGTDVAPATVAKLAGVGVGTLYRHFPTRAALVEAAYRSDLAVLCDSAAGLLAAEPSAASALRLWLERCVDHAITKSGMAGALSTAVASEDALYSESRVLLTEAIAVLLAEGSADASLRTDLSADDVLIAVSGVALATSAFGTREQASRLLDLLMDGLTKGVPGSSRTAAAS